HPADDLPARSIAIDSRDISRALPQPRDRTDRLPVLVKEDDADMDRRAAHVVHLIVSETEGGLVRAVERELHPFGDAPEQVGKHGSATDEAEAPLRAADLSTVIGRKGKAPAAQPGAHDAGLAGHVEEDLPARSAAGVPETALLGQHGASCGLPMSSG